MNSVVLFVSLMAFYVVLSGQITSVFLMSAGLVSCAGITLLCRRLGIVDDEGMPYQYWGRTLVYLPYLFKEIVKSNLDVLKIVWRPGALKVAPKVIRVPHSMRTAYGLVTYANSITLTPGTVTVEIGEDELLVHCLAPEFAEGLLTGDMEARCKRLEGEPVREAPR